VVRAGCTEIANSYPNIFGHIYTGVCVCVCVYAAPSSISKRFWILSISFWLVRLFCTNP
jgi:hypothetical protein